MSRIFIFDIKKSRIHFWASPIHSSVFLITLEENSGVWVTVRDKEDWDWIVFIWGRSLGRGRGNSLQYSCLEKTWTEEPGRLQSIALQRVGHDRSDLACSLYMFSLNFNFIDRHISWWFIFLFPYISFHFHFLEVIFLLSFPQECISPSFFAFGMGGCICLHDSLCGDSQVLAYSWLPCMQSIFASFFTCLEGKEKITWCSDCVCPGKALWAWKPWVFIIQAEGGIHFYLNRSTQLFFRLELTILHKTKKLYISMG